MEGPVYPQNDHHTFSDAALKIGSPDDLMTNTTN
jgi:hypothetical protein